MRPHTIPGAENMVLALQEEIRRSDESRYDHRLRGLHLVDQGMTAPEVSRRLGDPPWMSVFSEPTLPRWG